MCKSTHVLLEPKQIKNKKDYNLFLKSLFVRNPNKPVAFTIRSKKTGKDYTVKISTNKGGWTQVAYEREYLDFKKLGWYFQGSVFTKENGQTVKVKKLDEDKTISMAGIVSFLLDAIQKNQFDFLFDKMEIFHLGNCVRCGKTLTDAISIERGIGPVCARLVN